MRRLGAGLVAVAVGAALVLGAPGPARAKKKRPASAPVTGGTEGGPLSLVFRASDGPVAYWTSLDGERRVCSTLVNTGAGAVSLAGASMAAGPVVAVTVEARTTRVVCGSLDELTVLCLGGGNCSAAWRVDSLEALP